MVDEVRNVAAGSSVNRVRVDGVVEIEVEEVRAPLGIVYFASSLGLNALDNLANVLADEGTLPDGLASLDAPAATVGRAEDTELAFGAVLHNAVGAVGTALATLVALVDGGSRFNANATVAVVGKAAAELARAAVLEAATLRLTDAADRGVIRDHHVFAWDVVVDVGKVCRRALQVHVVLDVNLGPVSTNLVYLILPILQVVQLHHSVDIEDSRHDFLF